MKFGKGHLQREIRKHEEFLFLKGERRDYFVVMFLSRHKGMPSKIKTQVEVLALGESTDMETGDKAGWELVEFFFLLFQFGQRDRKQDHPKK